MSSEQREETSTISYEEKNNRENMRSALVTALFQLDPHKTFHLDTTPEEHLLFRACLSGNLLYLRNLLSQPSFLTVALTEKPWPYGMTKLPLYNLRIMTIIAAKSGHAEMVGYLLSIAQEERIVEKFFINRDTINAALSSENVEVFRALIAVDPSCVNHDLEYQGYPLNVAMHHYSQSPSNTLSTVQLLLENGANPNARFSRFRSYGGNISTASRNGWVEIVRLLLEHGAYILDSGAIQAAVSKGRMEVLDVLREHGADVDERPRKCLQIMGRGKPEEEMERASETPLHVAVREDQPAAARWLLDNCADLGLRDCRGRTAVDCAVEGERVELLEVFKEHLARDSIRS